MSDNAVVKKKIKDSVFCDLFSDPKYQLELYRTLHPEDKTVTVDDIENVTIKNILVNQLYNDLGFTVRDLLLILAEAQSTWSVNIIIRTVLYYAETVNNYITVTGQNRYGSKRLSIPMPEFYVIYTGPEDDSIKDEYRLSEEFYGGDSSFIDAVVKVIRPDKDSKDIINQYIMFTKILADQEKMYGRTREAIMETMRICMDRDILKEYLRSREQEVLNIMTTLYDQEQATRDYGRDMKNEGIQQGLSKGLQQGRSEGLQQGRSEGLQQGISKGVISSIELLRKVGLSDTDIADQIIEKFELTKDEAIDYMKKADVS